MAHPYRQIKTAAVSEESLRLQTQEGYVIPKTSAAAAYAPISAPAPPAHRSTVDMKFNVLNKNRTNASLNQTPKIIPHQILANQQIATNSKKTHPYLQNLSKEVTRSLESLRVNDSNSEKMNSSSSSPSGSNIASLDSPMKSNFASARPSPQRESFNSNGASNANPHYEETALQHNSYLNSTGSNNIASCNSLKTPNDKSNVNTAAPEVVKGALSQNSDFGTSSQSSDVFKSSSDSYNSVIRNFKEHQPVKEGEHEPASEKPAKAKLGAPIPLPLPEPIELTMPSGEMENDGLKTLKTNKRRSSLFTLHKRTRSTANILHPTVMETQGQAEEIQSQHEKNMKDFNSYPAERAHIRSSSVNLLPMEKTIQLYRENSKKTKNPEVLFSFAQILIKTSLNKRADNPLTDEERREYLDEAYNALKKSSKMGYIEALYYLGDAFSVGLFNKNGKPDLNKSLTYFETAGKSRHAESAYRTAICYKKGWGCSRDARKVLKFLEIAAMNNHPVAMMEYGIYAFHGLMGFSNDTNTKKSGISWLRRATECATELSCGAPYELALIYLNGFKDIVIQDTNYAIKLLFKASNLGHAKSATMLGKFYEIGDVVEQNPDLSIHFYNLSANYGDPEGMMGLCSWYFVGTDNLEQDYNEAFAWALKAAEEYNHHKAMVLLKRFYELGVGCDKDAAKATYWGELAAQEKKLIDKEEKKKKRNY